MYRHRLHVNTSSSRIARLKSERGTIVVTQRTDWNHSVTRCTISRHQLNLQANECFLLPSPQSIIAMMMLCSYIVGRSDPYSTANESSVSYEGIDRGGHWSPSPTLCVARQRLAIIVPFRNRETHLRILLRVLHPMLQRQLIDYTIFVIEQVCKWQVRIQWLATHPRGIQCSFWFAGLPT
jgi:N-terminal region of glycosyl transferase group 7